MKMIFILISLFSFSVWSAEAPVTLKLLTWNVYMLPKPVKFSVQGDRTQLIINELLKVDHDVIVLQEAFMKCFRRKVGEALKSKYPYQVDLGRSGRWKHVMTSGLFALSRYPMSSIDYNYYNQCTGADCFAAKGVLLLNLELPSGRNVHLSTTHLNAGDEEHNRRARWSQVEEIHDFYSRGVSARSESIPLILAGDLNIDVKEDDFHKTLSLLNMETPQVENPDVPSSSYDIPCYKSVKYPAKQMVDNVLLNPRKARAVIQHKRIRPFFGKIKGVECPLSDHQAIEAQIRIL